ncbi:glycerophosphodiester phosphodiesterase [Nocardioides mangrovicus]|uniref:Glycerophosphodiester phosphodiesterase n=2 Tax=Nocardioides mangrovicus TaxID=2478913 RepID=A0A3L8P1K6_9ACTN|nr:glycerophosphodiester phosphodiesterase [Nocardioides mangrovicus]
MAHRGGAQHPDLLGLENTAEAFSHATRLGYRYLETDVHATRDGVLVAFHDEVLDRVTDRTGRIESLTSAQLAEALIGGRHAVPRFAELLADLPDARFNVDLKSESAVRPLADLLRSTGAEDRVCVGAFSLPRIRSFRRLTGGRVATAAAPAEVARVVAGLPCRGPAVLQVPHRRGRVRVVTPRLVRRAHAARMHVHVWTVDDPAEMAELLDLGVDGLITDRTDLLREVLEQRGSWS